MVKYIDCDGVILDTESGLFDEYHELKKLNPELKKRQYLHDMDWEYWIWQAGVIGDAINILKNYGGQIWIIKTKVNRMMLIWKQFLMLWDAKPDVISWTF